MTDAAQHEDWRQALLRTAALVECAASRMRGPRDAWLAGGETTVTVRGDGIGGRNCELALAAVPLLAGTDLVLVTLASDGEDGPTDAAGAVIDGTTLARARESGLDPSDFLARNDAYRLFAALGDLVQTGPTGTNLCNLALVYRRPS